MGLDNEEQLLELISNKDKYFKEKVIQNIRWNETPKNPRKGWVPTGRMRYVHDRLAKTVIAELQAQLPIRMMGGRPGSTTKKMTKIHCNKEAVLKMDIKGCFDSISPNMIRKMLYKALNTQVSSSNLDYICNLLSIDNRLPQGAPCSTAICNCVLLPAFNSIDQYCESHDLIVSSWVDDFVISGPKSAVYSCIPKIRLLFIKAGLRVSDEKTTVQKRGGFGALDQNGNNSEVVGLTIGLQPTVHINKREFVRGQWLRAASGDHSVSLSRLKGKTEYIRQYHPGYVKRLKKYEEAASQQFLTSPFSQQGNLDNHAK